MQQKHVADCSAGYRQKHPALPDVQTSGDNNSDKFRDAMCSLQYIYIPETVHNKHAEDGRREILADILYEFRLSAVFTE